MGHGDWWRAHPNLVRSDRRHGLPRRRHRGLQRHSLRNSAARGPSLASATASEAVDGGSSLRQVWPEVPSKKRKARAIRRLFVPECLDESKTEPSEAPGHGLDSRWRIYARLRTPRRIRWNCAGQARRRRRHSQLSAGRVWIHDAPRIVG